ncbi:MAG: hypothetical protein BRC58_01840 [Cyanobacteria bacterium QS_8_64_29]|nr:MAG: hypothetical protein BRC58_01840 [Cyanobacteria bacterium QS_8_64_29]
MRSASTTSVCNTDYPIAGAASAKTSRASGRREAVRSLPVEPAGMAEQLQSLGHDGNAPPLAMAVP